MDIKLFTNDCSDKFLTYVFIIMHESTKNLIHRNIYYSIKTVPSLFTFVSDTLTALISAMQ
jgi:hypothetical protein